MIKQNNEADYQGVRAEITPESGESIPEIDLHGNLRTGNTAA